MPAQKFTRDQLDALAEMREAGMSCARIARRLGMSRGAVHWQCMRLGVVAPEDRGRVPVVPETPLVARRGDHVVRRFTRDEDARLLALEAEGLSIGEIARRLGRPANSVRGRLATLARHDAWKEAAA